MLYICGRCHCGCLDKWNLVSYGVLHIEMIRYYRPFSYFVCKETECQGLVPVNKFLKGHHPGELSAYWLLVLVSLFSQAPVRTADILYFLLVAYQGHFGSID